jgi:hypothetical protein
MAAKNPKILDYAPPPPPLKRRDSIEYYREPPATANWGIGMIIFWLLAFVGVFCTLWLLGRWSNAAS